MTTPGRSTRPSRRRPRVVTACPAIDAGVGDAGAWVNITPPQVTLDGDASVGAGKNFGTNAFVIDPSNSATLYLGTSGQGIYKTTDCGATWAHVNTGRNGATLDNGRQWAMLIDPTDPNVLYANSGYGTSGILKSTNGGVDWDQFLSPDVAKNFIFGGFVGGIAMDPTNHAHLILWPHFNCCDDAGTTCNDNCLLESENSGGSWTRIDVDGGTAQEGYGMMIVRDPSSPDNSKHWFLAETFGGLYETTDEGLSWHLVANASGYAYPSIYVAPDNSYSVPAAFNVIESDSGGSTWAEIPGSPARISSPARRRRLRGPWRLHHGRRPALPAAVRRLGERPDEVDGPLRPLDPQRPVEPRLRSGPSRAVHVGVPRGLLAGRRSLTSRVHRAALAGNRPLGRCPTSQG